MFSKILVTASFAAMAFVYSAHASIEGADGQQYVLGEVTLTNSAPAAEADYKITLASAKQNGCSVYSGIASVYGLNNGKGDSSTQALAGGGRLNVNAYTAAMKPPVRLHSTVKVVNKRNGKTVNVRVNDRGPYVAGRVIDLTPAAARGLGFSGLTSVEVHICGGNKVASNEM
jgi:rare lipoprotein A